MKAQKAEKEISFVHGAHKSFWPTQDKIIQQAAAVAQPSLNGRHAPSILMVFTLLSCLAALIARDENVSQCANTCSNFHPADVSRMRAIGAWYACTLNNSTVEAFHYCNRSLVEVDVAKEW